MKKLPLILLFAPVLLLGACRTEQAEPEAAMDEMPMVDASYDVYGEAFSDEGAVPVQAVAAEPDRYLNQTVTIEGTVSEVCQMAGCWLTLQVPDGNIVRIVVPRDEDGNYVYTVAKDISGRRAVVQGTLAREMVSEHDQQHMADDAAGGAMAEGDNHEHMDMEDDHHMDMEDGDDEPMAGDAMGTGMPELQLTATGVLVAKA